MKKISLTLAAVGLIFMGSCSGGKEKKDSTNEENEYSSSSTVESNEESTDESNEDIDIDITTSDSDEEETQTPAKSAAEVKTPASSQDFVLVPKSLEVGGKLDGYVSVADQEYALEENIWDGDPYYLLKPIFEIDKQYDFKEGAGLQLYIQLYDANGKVIHFNRTIDASDMSRAEPNDDFYTIGASQLLQAMQSGAASCTDVEFDIQSWFIKDFTPDMIKKAKYFKVFSKVTDKYGMEEDDLGFGF